MKIRTDFVSNSSSSSFCILGSTVWGVLDVLLKLHKDKISDEGFGMYFLRETDRGEVVFEIPGWIGPIDDPENEDDDIEVYGVGVELTSILGEDTTLNQAKDKLIELFKEYGVKVERKDLQIIYGESSNER